ncbi:MAG: GNAT family N-acetyltransferase [Burkholderiaceae bacterium]
MIHLRPMKVEDIAPVVEVIGRHDEDDGESAQAVFADADLADYLVLEHRGRVAGVTGCVGIPVSDGAFWLSWTYLDKALQGKGLGRELIARAIGQARERGGRKLFLKISDYQDPQDGDVYGAARRCYVAAGFREELTIRDYYDHDENLIVMGLALRPPPALRAPGEIVPERPAIELDRWFEIADTDNAYTCSWRVRRAASALGAAVARKGDAAFSAANLEKGLAAMRERGARLVVMSFPSNLPLVLAPLQAAGFERLGQLNDYYGQGLHEMHFAHYLDRP